ncbi:MAG: hypothetical protein JHC28_04345 [Thermoprotei archaeon]|nr:hypothetical protein [Thermoprotei archaeon]
MRCKCWAKLTVFSKDYISHSMIIERLTNAGLNYYQDEKILDIRLNVPCEETAGVIEELESYAREGYALVDIKCWGAEAERFENKDIVSIMGYLFALQKRGDKEIKLRLISELESAGEDSKKIDLRRGAYPLERPFIIPLERFTKMLPGLLEAIDSLKYGESKKS